jgi:hypothetical protein
VTFEDVVRLAIRGPMVGVGESASPQPYQALSYAPVAAVANAYRAAGAEGVQHPETAVKREE